jgi:hypothetical protein
VLGPRSTCARHARGDRRVPHRASGRACHARAFLVGNLDSLPTTPSSAEAFWPLPVDLAQRRLRARAGILAQTLVEERDSNQSHLRMSYRRHGVRRDRRAPR